MNIMVGTDPAGKGGIASVVNLLEGEGFLREQQIRYVVSHVDGPAGKKLLAAAWSLCTVAFLCARSPGGVVHVHSASRASFQRKSIALAVARLFGCKTVLHLHGGAFQLFSTAESGRFGRWWIRRTLVRTSCVIALSAAIAEFLATYAPGTRIEVVPNAVRVQGSVDCVTIQHARILFLGRMEKQKGLFDLMQAVALLQQRFPHVKLVIGGEGDGDAVQRAAKRLGITDQIELLGWISGPAKASQIARAQVFALPSYHEGLPVSMLEAMAAGKVVVVTPVGGVPDTVTHGEDALLTPVGEPAALAAALERVLGDEPLRRKLASNARATIERHFSTAILLKSLRRIYAELAPDSPVNGTAQMLKGRPRQ